MSRVRSERCLVQRSARQLIVSDQAPRRTVNCGPGASRLSSGRVVSIERFTSLATTQDSGSYRFNMRGNVFMKKAMAETLIEAFADRQLESARRAKELDQEVQSAIRPHQQASVLTAAERKDWGKSLSLRTRVDSR
ncbi:hypothetical protein PHSY_001630 [Pseudozyma hubeiensis SY62]|uniref:Uncharacterized protein n=1 Tax=Pseudozyma hubeiensis (strain SY62) TaxID=1305764 RepID=R9NZ88_PSEHS|nr:hypothetical protein PHSY_001630 [Pseudozyma hubeiensis SY62]GAC94061.1 hypothetical protein PHSY_001630 [Pseudozyma hubeiensis SY62]